MKNRFRPANENSAALHLTEQQLAICKACGISPESYLGQDNEDSTASGGASGGGLTRQQLAICKACGIPPDEYLKVTGGNGSSSRAATVDLKQHQGRRVAIFIP